MPNTRAWGGCEAEPPGLTLVIILFRAGIETGGRDDRATFHGPLDEAALTTNPAEQARYHRVALLAKTVTGGTLGPSSCQPYYCVVV